MDKIDAHEKFDMLKLYSAIAPRDDGGESLKAYSIWIANRMYADDKKKRSELIHSIMTAIDRSKQNSKYKQ